MVGQELEGDDVEDALEAVYRFRNGKEGELRFLRSIKGRIVFGDHEDGLPFARGDLVDCVLHLGECSVTGGHHDDWHELICKIPLERRKEEKEGG